MHSKRPRLIETESHYSGHRQLGTCRYYFWDLSLIKRTLQRAIAGHVNCASVVPAIKETGRAIKQECDRLESFQFDITWRAGRRVPALHNGVFLKVTLCEITPI